MSILSCDKKETMISRFMRKIFRYYLFYWYMIIRYSAYKHFASSLPSRLKNLKSRFYASTTVPRPKRDSREILKILRRATKKSCFGDRRSA